MWKIAIRLLFISFFVLSLNPVWAKPLSEFEINMTDWDEKSELASKYLKQAEEQLKEGDKSKGCKTQALAANYGIQATESLIKAFEISGSTVNLSDIKVGLNKWKQLRDFC